MAARDGAALRVGTAQRTRAATAARPLQPAEEAQPARARGRRVRQRRRPGAVRWPVGRAARHRAGTCPQAAVRGRQARRASSRGPDRHRADPVVPARALRRGDDPERARPAEGPVPRARRRRRVAGRHRRPGARDRRSAARGPGEPHQPRPRQQRAAGAGDHRHAVRRPAELGRPVPPGSAGALLRGAHQEPDDAAGDDGHAPDRRAGWRAAPQRRQPRARRAEGVRLGALVRTRRAAAGPRRRRTVPGAARTQLPGDQQQPGLPHRVAAGTRRSPAEPQVLPRLAAVPRGRARRHSAPPARPAGRLPPARHQHGVVPRRPALVVLPRGQSGRGDGDAPLRRTPRRRRRSAGGDGARRDRDARRDQSRDRRPGPVRQHGVRRRLARAADQHVAARAGAGGAAQPGGRGRATSARRGGGAPAAGRRRGAVAPPAARRPRARTRRSRAQRPSLVAGLRRVARGPPERLLGRPQEARGREAGTVAPRADRARRARAHPRRPAGQRRRTQRGRRTCRPPRVRPAGRTPGREVRRRRRRSAQQPPRRGPRDAAQRPALGRDAADADRRRARRRP